MPHIRNYLSAIAFANKINNFTDPTKSFRVKKLLEALKKLDTGGRQRKPVTSKILRKLIDSCRHIVNDHYEQALYRCLFLIMYHACLRVSEVTTSKNNCHCLQYHQISASKKKLLVKFGTFKHSNGKEVKIRLRALKHKLCPVRAYRKYIKLRGPKPGPIFIHENGKPITRPQIAATLHDCLQVFTNRPQLYNTHSFRIGKITDLAREGHSILQIKEMGRFKSFAFLAYIKPAYTTNCSDGGQRRH